MLPRLWPQAGFYLHRRGHVDIFEEELEIWNTLLKVYFISHKEHEAPQINDHNHVHHHRNPHAHHQQCDHNIKQYPLQREIIYFLGFIRLCHYKKVHFGNINFLSQNWFHHKKLLTEIAKCFVSVLAESTFLWHFMFAPSSHCNGTGRIRNRWNCCQVNSTELIFWLSWGVLPLFSTT